MVSGAFDDDDHGPDDREQDPEPFGEPDPEPFGAPDPEPFGSLPDENGFEGEFDDLNPDEALPADEDSSRTALPPKFEAWRQRSAMGAILTGFALGLQQALEPRRDEPSIVVQSSGDPPTDLPVEANFEFRHPRDSVVNVRPWLLNGSAEEAGTETGSGALPGPDDDPTGP